MHLVQKEYQCSLSLQWAHSYLSLYLSFRSAECLQCDGAYWIIVISVIAVVVVCVIIIILNPSLSSELRGPLFFFQVLPFIFKPNNHVGRVVISVGNILNFGGPFLYFTHICIVKGMTNLFAVAMGYLMPLVTLLVFVISYILSANFYLVRFKLRKHSSLQSFWLMTLFVYNYLAVTSFMLLNCPKVGGKLIFFYDGNVECFRGEHLAMTVVAFVVLFGFVISLPVVVLILTKGYWKVDPQYVNTLITGLRPQCRWWWSVDMFRRLLLLFSYSFIPHWFTKQVSVINKIWFLNGNLFILKKSRCFNRTLRHYATIFIRISIGKHWKKKTRLIWQLSCCHKNESSRTKDSIITEYLFGRCKNWGLLFKPNP